MNQTELPWCSATDLRDMYRARSVSPVEVTAAVLAQIDRHNGRLNAFAYLAPEQAMASARLAEQALMAGGALPPLLGIPATIKDLVLTRSMPNQSGSLITKGEQPTEDAPAAERLIGAGAVILGKTTTSEFGWTGVSRSPLTGETHNPWRHGLNAGASSAGAGVAAAAGFGPLHQGSDGAGSIRMPAHFCGIYGLKPTYGRIPYYPVSLGDMTSTIGTMTRTVADSALMLDVMAGPDLRDFTCLEASSIGYAARLHDRPAIKRIAFSPDLGHARVDPEIASLTLAAASDLASALGCEIELVSPPWGPGGPEIARFLWSAHMTRLAPHLDEWSERMDPGLVACIRAGLPHSVAEYQAVRARKYAYVTAIHQWFSDYDLLLTPAVSVPAFPLPSLMPPGWPEHEWDWLSWAEFSYPFNLSSNPAASVPCGFTTDGLPVGLQVVGRRFDELSVLQASLAFERARPWAGHRPTGFG